MGFKVYVKLKNEPGSANGLVFATQKEGESYGNDLLSRWFVPESFEVREHPELEPTDQWIEGEGLKKIGSDQPARMPARSVVL